MNSKRKIEQPQGPTRVALYTRISTDEAHQPYSLGAQTDRLESYVKSQDNWKAWRTYEDQMTGTVLERPGLQSALEDARRGRYDLLLVFRVDRLARSVRSLASILEELDQHGVAFRSATEPFDTSSPAGLMMVQMLGVFAEFERATLIERVIAGMEKKASKGGWNGGTTPIGYEYDAETGCLRVEANEIAVVLKIFELYVSDKLGTVSIARWLNENGYRTKRGALWSPKTVSRVLSNRVYLGEVLFRDKTSPGAHPAIVDNGLFDSANRLLTERGEDCSKRRSNASEYLLSGSLRCAHCKRRFSGTKASGNGGKYRYYTCTSRVEYGPTKCDQDRLPADDIEQALVKHLISTLRDGAVLVRSIEKTANGWDTLGPKVTRDLKKTEDSLKKMKSTIDRYLRAFETGAMTPEACGERIGGLNDQLEDLEGRRIELLDSLESEPETLGLDAVQEAAENFARQLEDADLPLLKHLIRVLVPDITVESRASIRPSIRLPLVREAGRWVGPAGIEPATNRL